MRYSVNNLGSKQFDIFTPNNDLLGNLKFDFWGIKKALITMTNGLTYQLTATGFWQSNILVTKDERPFAEIKPLLAKGLQITFNDSAQTFIFKKQSWASINHVLVDEQDTQLGLVEAYFKWKRLRNDYEIEINHSLLGHEINNMLPLLLMYCSCYLRMRHTTGGA